jgi:hypothetical protein
MLDSGMEIIYEEDWAAFYNNGKLEVQGDPYYVEEYVLNMLGVKTYTSDSLVNPLTQHAWETTAEVKMAEQAELQHRREIEEAEENLRRLRERKSD